MFFGQWAADFNGVEVPSDPDGLGEAVALLDRYTAELTLAVAEFHSAGAWELDGSTSAVAWLRARGMTSADAARLVLLAKKLARLPVLADAWVTGRVAGGQVQTVCAQVIDRHLELFAYHEAELVPTLQGLTVTETSRAMSLWRARADALDDGGPPRDEPCEARLSTTLDDRGIYSASLDAEGVALTNAALGLATSHDLDLPGAQRRGQAHKDIMRFYLDHQNVKAGGRRRPHLNIIVKEETIHGGQLEGFDVETGLRIGSETLQRLACDCEFHRVLMNSEGVILDYGRAVKDPPPELYNAVVLRDQHCRGPGCDRPAAWCHVHHVNWWERDRGFTSINNLVLLCPRCHGLVHRKGWKARLYVNGDFEITTPWGTTRKSRPPGRYHRPELAWLDNDRRLQQYGTSTTSGAAAHPSWIDPEALIHSM